MMNIFDPLPPDVLREIFSRLDRDSASSFRLVSRRLARYPLHHLFASFPPTLAATAPPPVVTTASVSFAPASTPVLTPSSHDHDHNASDTDMSSPEEDEFYEFEVTDEMIRRLSLIPRRNHDSSLENLPTELQFMIFQELDKIDSCCLGLAHPNLYVVYRAIHRTKMPLNTRRIGPNSLESAWEVVGRQECKHCGIYRCELHAHIKTWMPASLEYCAMKQNFGLPARDGAAANCFRGKPSKPKRCGRHPIRTTSVHQDDPQFNITSMTSSR